MSDRAVGVITCAGAPDSHFSKGVQVCLLHVCVCVGVLCMYIPAVETRVLSSRCAPTWILGVNPKMTGNTLPVLQTLRHEDHFAPSWI